MLLSVNYIHGSEIIHRDIKLENFLIKINKKDKQIETNSIILADLGFAFCSGGLYSPKSKMGTPAYIAPEMLTNKTYTNKIDCWSLGICLIELITGTSPFK